MNIERFFVRQLVKKWKRRNTDFINFEGLEYEIKITGNGCQN